MVAEQTGTEAADPGRRPPQAQRATVVGTPRGEVIAPQEAAVVCHCVGLPGGCPGSDFTCALVGLMMTADWANLARLALGFPGLVAAVRLTQGDEGAVTRLIGIAERARGAAASGGCRPRGAVGAAVHDAERSQRRALRRVQAGAITKLAGVYLDNGDPAPEELTRALDELSWAGWVSTTPTGDPLWDQRQVSLTNTGATHYAALPPREQPPGQHHRTAPAVPDPVFGPPAPQTPAGRWSSGPPPAAGHRAAPGGQSGPRS